MDQFQIILHLTAAIFLCVLINPSVTQADDIVQFPYEAKPCSCVLLTCTCCQGVLVTPISFSKTVCMTFKISILPIKADITIKLDNSTIAAFVVDPKNPPNYCIPIPDSVPVAMCAKLHDIKLIGLTALQICSTFYVNYETNQVFTNKFPCIKLSTTGIDMMSK
ncbi:uncharacterized protein LOC119677626 [Teleopsis dalmanni]|uniref:uncharacterized protein LOC119677626 n=1 Tax=Teleopsis dalmanni TaxID=139649 RepID=UPI000D329B86|nr:uncharacterized protein LOC119677626 [Teleopsis dalmanni]